MLMRKSIVGFCPCKSCERSIRDRRAVVIDGWRRGTCMWPTGQSHITSFFNQKIVTRCSIAVCDSIQNTLQSPTYALDYSQLIWIIWRKGEGRQSEIFNETTPTQSCSPSSRWRNRRTEKRQNSLFRLQIYTWNGCSCSQIMWHRASPVVWSIGDAESWEKVDHMVFEFCASTCLWSCCYAYRHSDANGETILYKQFYYGDCKDYQWHLYGNCKDGSDAQTGCNERMGAKVIRIARSYEESYRSSTLWVRQASLEVP